VYRIGLYAKKIKYISVKDANKKICSHIKDYPIIRSRLYDLISVIMWAEYPMREKCGIITKYMSTYVRTPSPPITSWPTMFTFAGIPVPNTSMNSTILI
jgi:hypothetical protein